MSEVVVVAGGREISRSENIELQCNEIRAVFSAVQSASSREDLEKCLVLLDNLVLRLPAIRDELALGMRPADQKSIRDQLKSFIACYPNGAQIRDAAAAVSAATYSATLSEDIESIRPSIISVMAGCRKLRRELKFLPSIAEVYQAIEEAQRSFKFAEEFFVPKLERLRDEVREKVASSAG